MGAPQSQLMLLVILIVSFIVIVSSLWSSDFIISYSEVRETSMRAWLENTTVDLKDLEVCDLFVQFDSLIFR